MFPTHSPTLLPSLASAALPSVRPSRSAVGTPRHTDVKIQRVCENSGSVQGGGAGECSPVWHRPLPPPPPPSGRLKSTSWPRQVPTPIIEMQYSPGRGGGDR